MGTEQTVREPVPAFGEVVGAHRVRALLFAGTLFPMGKGVGGRHRFIRVITVGSMTHRGHFGE